MLEIMFDEVEKFKSSKVAKSKEKGGEAGDLPTSAAFLLLFDKTTLYGVQHREDKPE